MSEETKHKQFDVKNIDEELNVCDKCGIIVRWYDEMYWQSDFSNDEFHDCMTKEYNKEDDYTALCDECFSSLPNTCKRKCGCENIIKIKINE
tara:strand:+ start:964 stop:1239 length:276 start_codon:yes stop_codon:yes gene_type:complete